MKAIGATGADKEVLNQVFIKHLTKFIEAEEMWQILLNCDKGQGRGDFWGTFGGQTDESWIQKGWGWQQWPWPACWFHDIP